MWLGDEDSIDDELADLKARGASRGLLGIVKKAAKAEVLMINFDQDAE
jgi:hypothetical protein